MTELTIEHFLKVHEMLASYYGAQSPTLPGVTLAFRALKNACPALSAEQFDWAVSDSLLRCKFHPRLSDFMESLFDKDLSSLPALPDIDPRYADSYQLNILHRAENENRKAAANCPLLTTHFRVDRLGQIPGTSPVDRHSFAPSVEEWNRERTLDAGKSGPALAGVDF